MKKNNLMVTTWAVPNKDLSQYEAYEEGKKRIRIGRKRTVETFYSSEVERLKAAGVDAHLRTRKSPITGLTEIAVFREKMEAHA